MAREQFVILGRGEAPESGMPSIGTRTAILTQLADYNTSPEQDGGDILFGPGIVIQLPPGQDDVTQMILTISEEDIGWLVVQRLAGDLGWRLLDPNTGREWTPSGATT